MTDNFVRSANVLHRRLEGEMVLVHTETEEIWRLNETAADIWDCLQTNISEGDLISLLGAQYSVDEADLLDDVKNVLEQLVKSGLVEKTSGAA